MNPMPAYNFKKQFADLVESGKKRQTIRKLRKRPTVAGDKLFLYTGMRTKRCMLLMKTTCALVFPITIQVDERVIFWGDAAEVMPKLTAKCFVQADGFVNFDDFFEFFWTTYGNEFQGQVIYW